ncbi:MAG TPA: heme o synthase [Pyrinomonadaceae bacterium]|nr:heme o synthase [Pyrinomonadaceae bacterium]
MNNPPTSVGGIQPQLSLRLSRQDLKPSTNFRWWDLDLSYKGLTNHVQHLVTLTKPEITLMVMISAGVACFIASNPFNFAVLLHAILGTGLVGASAATLNQYLERKVDATMRRTSRRPLPSGHVTAREALVFGVSLFVVGTIYLSVFLNPTTALIGLLTSASYLFLYTPLKRKSRFCTFIGAFPGAAPVLMGWTAARNDLAPEAWVLFAILFLWQFPHFYAIGWLYREDYARAGMLMLPAIDEDDGRTTFRRILISTQLLIVATFTLPFIASTSSLYFGLALILGLSFYYCAYKASLSRSRIAAKRLLHASVIYLPLLYLAIVLDKLFF